MKGVAARERAEHIVVGPAEWPMVRLRDVATFAHGSTPSKANCGYWDGAVPWVSPKDFRAQRLADAQDHISETAIEEGEAVVATPGSVLVVVRSGILKRRLPVAIADVRLTFNQDVKSIRPVAGHLRAEYLALMLRAAEPCVVQDGVKVGPTVHSIKSGYLENFSIPLPPLAEQERIAGRLTEQLAAVERARGAAQARLAAAEALPAAYLREVFEGPQASGWEAVTIRDLAETCSGATPPRGHKSYFGGDIPWVKTGELQDGPVCADGSTEETVSPEALRDCSLPLLPPGTLLIAMYGQGKTRGRTGLLMREGTTNQACFAILPRPDMFDSGLLQYWFRANYSRLRALTEARGGNQPNLNGVLLRELEVTLPPLPAQRRIAADLAARLAGAERLAEGIRAELAAIEALPAALLREAFGGSEVHE
ncbi:MAG: restriction endonuclease subunit S [Phycisphaerae bacterium]|nr:restriction endonuclease subunit S [Phycisphaerae bacterium]